MSPVRQPDSSAARVVSIRRDIVVKTQEPGASRRERLRTLAGREVGLRTGLLVVPEIVSFDDARRAASIARIWMRHSSPASAVNERSYTPARPT